MAGTLLEKQVRHISMARAVQYGGIAMWVLAGPALAAGIGEGFHMQSWDPVVHGIEAGGALYCGGPVVATIGWGAKQIEKHKAHQTAKYMSGDVLATMVRQHGHISKASTAAEIFNITTLLGLVALPPPLDILSGIAHVGGRVITATKITHSAGMEALAWKRLVFPPRRR